MRKSLIVATIATTGLFGAGYVVGQIHGAMSAAAASKQTQSWTTFAPRSWWPRASGTATPRPPHADGKITAVNGNTITVAPDSNRAGSNEYSNVTTIVLTNTTTFMGSTTRASIVTGAYIFAEGTLSSDGKTLTATAVGVGGPGGGHHGGGFGRSGPHADGTVVSLSGNTVTVKADDDTNQSTEYSKVTSVVLTNSTTFVGGSTRASIVGGAHFFAEGTLSSDGTTLTATTFGVGGSGGRGGFAGRHAHFMFR